MTSTSVITVQQGPWHAKISVNGNTINFRVDTGADVTVLRERFFRMNSHSAFRPWTERNKGCGQFQA